MESAEPNYCGLLNAIPNDIYYVDSNPKKKQQWSLHPFLADAARAWDFQTGIYSIKVGIIDDGINWHLCDMGDTIGPGFKVAGGWNYVSHNTAISDTATHGTPVTGIIGALTNRSISNCPQTGIAGIAGGWYDNIQYPPVDSLGCQIWGV